MKDFDSAERAHRIHVWTWSIAGGVIGGFLGLLAAGLGRWPAVWTIIGGFVLGTAAVFLMVTVIGGSAGSAMASIFAPSGTSTRGEPELSLAESLSARGRYYEAAAEYRRQADLAPAATEPRLRLARLYRDRLNEPERAVDWYRQAGRVSGDPAAEAMALRELTELLDRRMGAPTRAMPDLARYVELHPDVPAADWARRELARLRSLVRSEQVPDADSTREQP